MTVRNVGSWIEPGSATNAPAAAARPAPAGGLRHNVTSLSGSYSAAAVGVLLLKEGTTERGRWHVHDHFEISFYSPIAMKAGAAISLELSAGGDGIEGAVVLTGFTL